MISSALYLVPVLDCLCQSNSELTVALQDLGNPGGNDDGSGGFGDDDHHHDDDYDDDDDDDDGKNEDAGTCRTLSRLWSLAELEGCFPQEASYSRSPENDNDINGDDDTAKDYNNKKKRKKGKKYDDDEVKVFVKDDDDAAHKARKGVKVVVLALYKAVHYEPAIKTFDDSNDDDDDDDNNSKDNDSPPLGLV